MKHCISLLWFLFMIMQLQGQTLEEMEKAIAAKNKIKTQTQWDYSYEDGKPAAQGKKTCITEYTKLGDILNKKVLNNKGTVINWEKYEYDQKGNRTLYENAKYKKVSRYDANNNLISESGFNGAENFINTYTFTSKGSPHEIIYNVNGKVDQKMVYEHSGNTAEVNIYAAGGTLTSKLKLVYDAGKHITQETTLSVDGREIEKKTYKFGVKGNLLSEEKTRGGTLFYRISYSYNQAGNLLTVSHESPTEQKFVKKSFTYDAKGNLTQYKWRRKATEEFNVKTYTYDARGICLTEHTLYPSTKFELLSKYKYEFY